MTSQPRLLEDINIHRIMSLKNRICPFSPRLRWVRRRVGYSSSSSSRLHGHSRRLPVYFLFSAVLLFGNWHLQRFLFQECSDEILRLRMFNAKCEWVICLRQFHHPKWLPCLYGSHIIWVLLCLGLYKKKASSLILESHQSKYSHHRTEIIG